MKKRKHQFHCQFCGMPCEIYKRGKSHRVLVCPSCGILANNPGKLSNIFKATGKVFKSTGGISGLGMAEKQWETRDPKSYQKVASLVGSQIGYDPYSQGQAGSTPYPASPKQTIIHKSERDYLFTPEEKVNLALK